MNEISAIVCTKNAEKTLLKTLDSLIKNNVSEIIVVDGNSTDNTIDISEKYTNEIYSDGGKGLAYARQLGVQKAKEDYVAFVDADTELKHDYTLNKMLKELEDKNWVAIHAQVIDPRENKSYWEAGENFHFSSRFNIPGEKTQLGTIVCIIKKDLLIKYGFDESFKGAAEDADFFYRLYKEGYKFGVSKMVVYHYHRSGFKNFVNQRIWYGEGNSRAIIKHKAIHLLITPIVIGVYGVLLSIYKKKPKFIPFYIIWMVILLYGTIKGVLFLNESKIP